MLTEDKIRELYNAHGGSLYIYIYRFVRSADSAEDVLQDCFMRLIEYSRKHEVNLETIRPFLYRTAHNLCVNSLKRGSIIEFVPVDNDYPVKHHEGPESAFEFDEINRAVNEIVDSLDSEDKTVFLLKKELGKNTAEIAELVGKSERTVRRRLNRALEALEEGLKNRGFTTLISVLLAIILISIVVHNGGW